VVLFSDRMRSALQWQTISRLRIPVSALQVPRRKCRRLENADSRDTGCRAVFGRRSTLAKLLALFASCKGNIWQEGYITDSSNLSKTFHAMCDVGKLEERRRRAFGPRGQSGIQDPAFRHHSSPVCSPLPQIPKNKILMDVNSSRYCMLAVTSVRCAL
jgi:hypothetical protein